MAAERHTDAESLVEGLEHAARIYWPALLLEGIALLLFGILALFIPPLITFGIASVLGWLFLSSGVAVLLVYFWARTTSASRSLLFSAVLSIAAGVVLLLRPISGVISLTVILVIFFALGGAAKLYYPLDRSHELARYRGWIRASGMIDLVLAIVMFTGLPEIALWAPGLLLGANMVLGGTALVVVAAIERRRSAAQQKPAVGDRSDVAGLNRPAG
jgi:uncharacterized membrane protein HdeD (DUF308 family)